MPRPNVGYGAVMFVASGFEAVREAFAADPRGGSALAVLRHGETVVDLHEGWRDAARTRPWDADTLVNVYSVGKPVIALAVLLLVERGLIALDDPMARHWPSFRTDASVRQVLTHTAALPAFPVPRDSSAWSEWDVLCADLAAATPEWEPGTVAAEHALTYGHLLGELVRRVDGRSPAAVPAVNLHATAMSIARFYAALLDGRLPGATMAAAQFEGVDLFIGSEVVWGLGVQIEPDGTWGMGGLGGNAGWADPRRGLAIAYVTRRLGDFAAVDRIDAGLSGA
jgi:CubicO group peptidase (beta-lactamase class C family)